MPRDRRGTWGGLSCGPSNLGRERTSPYRRPLSQVTAVSQPASIPVYIPGLPTSYRIYLHMHTPGHLVLDRTVNGALPRRFRTEHRST